MSAQNATVQSLVYGIPLLEYVIFANAIANSSGTWTTNTLVHSTTLATPSSHAIVLPNVDTLYSSGLLDLSGGDIIATMPPLEEGRFYVWPFYDLYSNNVCNIGTITNSTAGKYLIKYRASKPGCVAANDEYAGTIYLPTVYGATLLRIEVGNSSDVDYVVSSIQPNFTLEVGPSALSACAPALTAELLNAGLTTSDLPLYILQLTARLAANNPPDIVADIAPVTAILETAGVSLTTNTYTQPTSVDLALAYTAAEAVLLAVGESATDFESLGNGWKALAPSLCGNFLSHYDVRGFIAVGGYLQLQASVAIYPVYELGQDLYSNQTYMVEFFGKPQVNGFWSLTMYDSDGFLVPNSLDRYSLNDRGNMTYPDGTLVYGGASPSDSIEPFLHAATNHGHPGIGRMGIQLAANPC
ncbi:DUF1254-domain-containing protein [Mycena sanguinolenta]|uniref:DUF1254-domain-containing protein n=1 Tax=Mycena sanguinolenta TaxID=230812 RepID=A0A8H7DMT5_9AGAR|nr:DUF1254-domain-containing protein [Mycena sanguinolenta]